MPFRILMIFIYFFIFFLRSFAGTQYSEYRRASMFGNTYNDVNDLSSWISKKIRRNAAQRKCRKFLKKRKNCYTLSNKLVILIYNADNYTLYCRDKADKRNISNYDYINQLDFYDKIVQEKFDEIFDILLSCFNENANYAEITEFLNLHLTPDKKNQNIKTNQNHISGTNTKEMQTTEEYFANKNTVKVSGENLDINKANEEELSKLPGISVIIAKKIIKHREANGGFKSIEEFYKEMKIKPHFQKQLNDLIFINKNTVEEVKTAAENNNERIIDL